MLMVPLSVQVSRADPVFCCFEDIITGFIKDSGGWRLVKFKPKRYMKKFSLCFGHTMTSAAGNASDLPDPDIDVVAV